jgi:hypothetical protein
VRAETNELEAVVVRLTVNENEIRLKMAIAKILPLAGERMIDLAARERLIGCQHIDDLHEQRIEPLAMPS